MARIISGTYTSTQTLSNSAIDNPATVTGTITVSSSGQIALYGSSGFAWTVANVGTVESTGNKGVGVDLASGGVITNGSSGATSALLLGGGFGLRIRNAAGTVNNYATIESTGYTAGAALYLGQGGVITNQSTGLISSNRNGIGVHGGPVTIINAGTISHVGSGTEGEAIYLGSGGSINNTGLIIGSQPGTAPNEYPGAITAHNQPATVTNSGTITNLNNSNGIDLASGGSVQNSGLISSPRTSIAINGVAGTIDNSGTVTSTAVTVGVGMYLGAGGTIVNEATGLITAVRNAVFTANATATVINRGTIQNSGTNAAVYSRAGGVITNTSSGVIESARTGISFNDTVGTTASVGIVVNAGSILTTGTAAAAGVYLAQGGTVTNQASGLISAYRFGISSVGTAATIANLGSVLGTGATAGTGIFLGGGGKITNGASNNNAALISGAIRGISIGSGIATIDNFGTVASGAGSSGTAINLGTVGGQSLTIESGSSIVGVIGNMQPRDTIDLPFLTFNTAASTYTLTSQHVLEVTEGSSTFNIALDPNQNLGDDGFQLSADSGGGTLITVEPPFQPAQLVLSDFAVGAGGWSSQDLYPRVLGDVNGDGRSDIVGFGQDGVWVALANGSGGFASPSLVLDNFAVSAGGWSSEDTYPRTVGDVNGDGSADIVGFGQDGVWVSLANGSGGFAAPSLVLDNFAAGAGGWSSDNTYPRELADVNGDGKSDIVGFGQDGVWVSLANGSGGFTDPKLVLDDFAVGAGGWTSQDTYPRQLGDVNGDGLADIVGFGQAGVWVALATGSGNFADPKLVLNDFAVGAGGWTSDNTYPRVLADVNGDRKADIVGFGQDGVWVADGNANGGFDTPTFDFSDFGFSTSAGGWVSQDTDPRGAANVTGGGAADLIGFGYSGVYVAASDLLHH